MSLNLVQDLDFFMTQGPVFWAAAASIGLGGALLVGSLIVWMRRRTGALRLALRGMRRGRPDATRTAPSIEITDTGYAVGGAPRATDPPADETGAAERARLEGLLDRLRSAADRLESTLEASDSKEIFQPALKPEPEADEIETRVGVC